MKALALQDTAVESPDSAAPSNHLSIVLTMLAM